MEIVRAGDDDRQAWDSYVEGHASVAPYHLWPWGEAVEAAYRHRKHYLMAVEKSRVVGALPLVEMKSPLRAGILVSLPYCDVGGSLADDPRARDHLARSALDLARQVRAEWVELRESGRGPGSPEAKVRMMARLPGGSAPLWDSLGSKVRSQVRKAEKNGLTFAWKTAAELDLFYEVFSRNMRDLGSPVHSMRWLAEVARRYRDRARIGVVYLDAKPVGCGMILVAGRTASIPWASTVREYNRLAPNMLLYWKLIGFAAESGLDWFDFGRSTPGEGTYRFKQQWGAEPVGLCWRRIRTDGSTEVIEAGALPGRAVAAKLWSRLPLPLANAIGPMLRRHLSL